jgi:hypothetical protein
MAKAPRRLRSRIAKGVDLVRGEGTNLKKPAKTREQLESAIRMEMEDICEWPAGLAISVVPHEDSWKVAIMAEGRKRRSGERHDRDDRRQAAQPVRPEKLNPGDGSARGEASLGQEPDGLA